MKKSFLWYISCIVFTHSHLACMQAPPPPPMAPGAPGIPGGKVSFKEDAEIKNLLGSDYDAFKKLMTEKEIRTKTWNVLLNDPDKRGPDFAQLFKDDKAKFNEILAEVDKAKESMKGVGSIKLMLQGKAPSSEKPKPQAQQSSNFNPLVYISKLQELIKKVNPEVSPLLATYLLNQKTVDEFKKYYSTKTGLEPTKEMLDLFEVYLNEIKNLVPIGLKIDKKPLESKTISHVNKLGEALAALKA